jgi:hypothetical protein
VWIWTNRATAKRPVLHHAYRFLADVIQTQISEKNIISQIQ